MRDGFTVVLAGRRPEPLHAVAQEGAATGGKSVAVAVNLTGAFLCMQEAFRMMEAQAPRGGRIINNGSIAGISPRPHAAAYAAAKAAMTGLTKAALLEGRSFDIAVGQIDVGNAATARTERMKTPPTFLSLP